MLSKIKRNFIRSLEQKKMRDKHGLFLAEGDKICRDLLHSTYEIDTLCCTSDWGDKNRGLLADAGVKSRCIVVAEEELKAISLLDTPNKVLAVARKKSNGSGMNTSLSGPAILLENVQDPGNLGTIIRTADWFGITTVICSEDTVDFYNPKVIQSAMGSSFRVNHENRNLEKLLIESREGKKRDVYAMVLGGDNLYREKLDENGFFLFGNEASGISQRLLSLCRARLSIPPAGAKNGKQPADSLNVAIAAAVVMAEFARQRQN